MRSFVRLIALGESTELDIDGVEVGREVSGKGDISQNMRKHKGSWHTHQRTMSYVQGKRCRGKWYQAKGPAGQAETALCVFSINVAWKVQAPMEMILFRNKVCF